MLDNPWVIAICSQVISTVVAALLLRVIERPRFEAPREPSSPTPWLQILRERWYLARVAPQTVDLSGLTDAERAMIVACRWWTLDELDAAVDLLVPGNLAALVRSLLRDGLPETPIALPL